MRRVVLLGDSLTEQCYLSEWGSKLGHAYSRKATVINGGLSGYNSRWYRDIVCDEASRNTLLSLPSEAPVLFATLLLGCNDLASNEQHIPVEEFREHITFLIDWVIKELRPVGGVFVMTPPPIDEKAWTAENDNIDDRSLADCRRYRLAVMEAVDAALQVHPDKVHLVDLQTAMLSYGRDRPVMEEEPYSSCAPYTALLRDGLHFNSLGGELVFQTLMAAVRRSPQAKKIVPEKLGMVLPYWRNLVEKKEE